MALGAISAVTQTDVKRMLAYSSIAHAGFILTGMIAANKAGLSATMFYLVAYGFSTLGAFAVVGLVRDATARPPRCHVGPAWAAIAAGGRGVRAVPARVRGHPVDQRLRQQVRGLPGRRAGWRDRRW